MKMGWFVSLVLVLFLCGCIDPPRKFEAEVDEPLKPLVEGYPEPVDPATLRKKSRPAPTPPKILVNGELSTLVYTCRAAHCDILRDAIESFVSPEGAIQSVPSLNKILLKDTSELVPGLLKLIEALDQPYPQLLIEARIVEITLENDEQFEISHIFRNVEGGGGRFLQDSDSTLKTPGSATSGDEGIRFNFRTIAQDFELDTFIRDLAANSRARILSSPNLIVGVNYQANLNTGEEVPIQSVSFSDGVANTTTTFKNVGIKLRVKPTQITPDTAQMEISPEVSTVVRFTDPGPSGVSNPVVAVRNVRTSLTVKDGEIITIGGLLRSEDRDTIRKVPGVGDLPLIGELFKSTRKEKVKTALIFFLRMNILEESTPDTFLFHQPGALLEKVDDEVEKILEPVDGLNKSAPGNRKNSRGFRPNPEFQKNPQMPKLSPLDPVIIDLTPKKSTQEEDSLLEQKREEKNETEKSENTEKPKETEEKNAQEENTEKSSEPDSSQSQK